MSVRVRHFVRGVEFVPVNKDSFSLIMERNTSEYWKQDFNATNRVVLPQEGYVQVLNSFDTIGAQQQIDYTLEVGGRMTPMIIDPSEGISVNGFQMEVGIKNFKSKDNVVDNLKGKTFQVLQAKGKITDADMIRIPYVVIRDNQSDLMINYTIMTYVVTYQTIESVKTTSELYAEAMDAFTPDITAVGVPTIKLGTIIKYSLLLALEAVKLAILILALRQIFKMLFELMWSKVRYFKAMTFDRMLTIGLADEGLTYSSSLKQHFEKCTAIPIPVDEQKLKFYQILEPDDNRILNRGYPTASDTIQTVNSLIEEICKMFNVEPILKGTVLTLEPKGYKWTLPKAVINDNMNYQEKIDNQFNIDLSECWGTKIISYTNDISDKLLFDNPKGLRTELFIEPKPGVIFNEKTKLKGISDIRINFALCSIKKETFVEKQMAKLAKMTDKLLNTNFMGLLKQRQGILALSQTQFSQTKLIYQVGGKQTSDYISHIGAYALYTKYHKIDDPQHKIFKYYEDMPVGMNNEQFNMILDNNIVDLQGRDVEVMKCEYTPEMATASISYRIPVPKWLENIIVKLAYNE